MKKFVERVVSLFKKESKMREIEVKNESMNSIVGSWRLVKFENSQGEEVKPHWREIWSFASMDSTEVNGVYVCDYINLHSVVGKWEIENGVIKLIRKGLECYYNIEELTHDSLLFRARDDSEWLTLISFKREE